MDMSPRGLILFAIGVAVLVAVVPAAITSIFDADTTNWSTAAVGLWLLLGLVIVAGIILFFVPSAGKGT